MEDSQPIIDESGTIYGPACTVLTHINLYMQTKILSGSICVSTPQGRLLDKLNETTGPESDGGFLELFDVTIRHREGKDERAPTVYVSKATIHLVATMTADVGRGLAAQVGLRQHPFREKLTVPVRLETASYAVIGNMHVATYENVWDNLVKRPTFLPLTHAEVHALASDTRWKIPFIAVNRDHIILLQEEIQPQ